ncbi:MAG: hypothetical protein GOP50_12815 [Candidatus Heimdallarchaeota archaeon]|nr:hypothetical protein [Candidatus Heimdallarchaeota archaeon]
MQVTYGRYPELPRFLKTFVEFTATSLATRSFILFGDVVLDDFSKRYSLIKVIIVLEKGLWEKDFNELDSIIDKLSTMNKDFSQILRAYFVPYIMLENPRINHQDLEGMVVANLQQEIINQYPLSPADDFMIMKQGEVLYGVDLRKHFPIPPIECFWHQFLAEVPNIEEVAKSYPFQHTDSPNYDHATNWILYLSRVLFSIKNNDIIGKMKGAYWFSNEYLSKLGDFVVEVAMCRQRNISLSSVMGVVEHSRELLLFCLEKAFTIKGIFVPDLKSLYKEDQGHANFSRIFMEIRNIIENL